MTSSRSTEVEPLLGPSSTPSHYLSEDDNAPRRRNRSSSNSNRRSLNDALGPADLAQRGEGGYRFIVKLLATICSFTLLGIIISTPGVVLPHLEEHYHLNDIHASLIFLVAPVGYLLGARLNEPIHHRLGQRGIALLAPVCQIVFTGIVSIFHNPHRAGFPLFLVATVVGNVGSGLLDGSWCAWAGGLGGKRTNTVQGLLHGSFSVGAGLGPFLAGTMFSVWKWPWWTWYHFLLIAVVLQGLVLYVAFHSEDGRRYEDDLKWRMLERGDEPITATAATASSDGCATAEEEVKGLLHYRATWICAAYFLAYVGTEAAISGWIVTFMQRVRHASPYLASLSSTGFWLGMAAGRLALGPVTDRFHVRSATTAYLLIAITLQAGLAGVGVGAGGVAAAAAILSTVLITAIGFFLGPLFPSGIVVLARALPRHLHVGAVSFVASVGQLGAALLPFLLGSLSQWLGIRVFQGFILAMLVGTLLIWCSFPPLPPPLPITTRRWRRRSSSSSNEAEVVEAEDGVLIIKARQEIESGNETIGRGIPTGAVTGTAHS
ncbi:hypothetical protein N0V82_006546 [Gnomoniopsis sp. IMI 355080]|nr:hypothetical protein N0V82_006546 [Gnomoniopsis sp. IMI 355080]